MIAALVGAVTLLVVMNVKLSKFKVKRYPLTPERKALVAEAQRLYRTQVSKGDAIKRLRLINNGERRELWAAATTIRTPMRDNKEAVAVGTILRLAASPYTEAHRITLNLPEPSQEEKRLRRLPGDVAFSELLEREPRLSEALAIAEQSGLEAQQAGLLERDAKHQTKSSHARQKSVDKLLRQSLTPLVGPKADTSSPLLGSNAAFAIAFIHLEEVAGVRPKPTDPWTRS
jgi:hypothetical protein